MICPVAAHLRLGLVSSFALLLAGCGPCRTNASVEEAAREHLADRYGESFLVSDVRRATGTIGDPKPFTGVFSYRATPVGRPDVVFKGRVEHDDLGRRTFWDDYACMRVREWLLPALDDGLGPRRRLVEPRLGCDYDRLPAEARRPLPDGAVTLRANLQTFEAGDPVQRVAEARSDLEALGVQNTVRWWGAVTAHPPGAWPAARALDLDPGAEASGRRYLADDWTVMTSARMDDSRRDDPPTRWGRDEVLERRITEAIRELRPKARVGVWVGPVGVARWKPRADVRIAESGLDAAGLESVGARVKPLVSGMSWRLSGLDSAGPGEDPQAAYICQAGSGRCHPTLAVVTPPEALAPVGP